MNFSICSEMYNNIMPTGLSGPAEIKQWTGISP